MLAFLFSPSDRFSRRQWWLAQVLIYLIFGILLVIPGKNPDAHGPAFAIGYWLAYLPLLWMIFCSNVKRLHDHNKSAWWFLLLLVPYLGEAMYIVYLGSWAGDLGKNDYGLAPHGISKQVNL
jgi:uncharacterized membrane protein YhaH (DUF805 family)